MRAIIDLETSGFSKSRNGIVEIAVLAFNENYEAVAQFSSLVYPYFQEGSETLIEYKPAAMKVNGIDLDKLTEFGKTPKAICNELDVFIDQYDITEWVAHNMFDFDEPRIKDFFRRFGGPREKPRFRETGCTLVGSRRVFPGFESHSLEYICKRLEITNKNPHRALSDCFATLKLLEILEN